MEIEHPAAKMMVEIAKTQEKEVGDGTTTAVMFAGKLIENAEKLLDKKIAYKAQDGIYFDIKKFPFMGTTTNTPYRDLPWNKDGVVGHGEEDFDVYQKLD